MPSPATAPEMLVAFLKRNQLETGLEPIPNDDAQKRTVDIPNNTTVSVIRPGTSTG
jgi:hypothetical protein